MNKLAALCLVFALASLHATDNDTIYVGVMTPLTSTSHVFGRDHLQAITLAVAEANREAAFENARIKLIVEDDQSDPTLAREKATELYNRGAVAVLGPCNSAVALAVINDFLIKDKAKLPFISALATAPGLTKKDRHPYFFRANVSDDKRMAEAITLVIQSTHPTKIALVCEGSGDPFGQGMKAAAEKTIHEKFPTMSAPAIFEHDRNIDHTKAAELIQNLKAQGYGGKSTAIVFLDLDYDAQVLAEEARAIGFSSYLYLIESDHRRIESALREGKNLGGLRTVSAFYPKNAALHPFPEAFKEKFGEEITFASALSYDAAQIVISAIRKTILADPAIIHNLPAFREAIAEDLRLNAHHDISFVLSGNQKFEANEYTSLRFNGYHFTNQGVIVPWNEPLGEPFPQTLDKIRPPTPAWTNFVITVLAAIVGSWLRKVLKKNAVGNNWRGYATAFKDARVLVVDPVLALMMFPCLYLWVLTYKLEWFYAMGGPATLFPWGAFVVGGACGIAGTSVLNKLLGFIGLEFDDPKEAPAQPAVPLNQAQPERGA